jgi:hypothetical protein
MKSENVTSTDRSGRAHQAARWLFRNRRTGRLTVMQWPNISLSVFALSSLALHVLHPRGGIKAATRILADVALVTWAADELLRGVNPFRRILGGGVLLMTIVGLA